MERLVALFIGIAGVLAFFSTLWVISLEKRLAFAGKKEQANREKILELEAKNTLAELKLSEYRKRLSYFEEKELKDQREKILSVISKAKKAVKLCTPKISENLEAVLKKTKAKTKILSAEPHTKIGKADLRVSNSIDVTIAILDDSQAYLVENNKLAKFPKQKLSKIIKGFDLLWKQASE